MNCGPCLRPFALAHNLVTLHLDIVPREPHPKPHVEGCCEEREAPKHRPRDGALRPGVQAAPDVILAAQAACGVRLVEGSVEGCALEARLACGVGDEAPDWVVGGAHLGVKSCCRSQNLLLAALWSVDARVDVAVPVLAVEACVVEPWLPSVGEKVAYAGAPCGEEAARRGERGKVPSDAAGGAGAALAAVCPVRDGVIERSPFSLPGCSVEARVPLSTRQDEGADELPPVPLCLPVCAAPHVSPA
eukprot:CAMPEP_0173433770 /NCGR_PEP_ID=MMETSP1357-20121228/11091_1 /TAXON_ID=77926 /ORGANISM="Hemiselmis rufescens, Strain PCC563" /LENGTH=245 /DNA_ID=CAMNT_0014398505 /DNA_START=464 /DNA_END=1201 /DNA_ORIENTATION=+